MKPPVHEASARQHAGEPSSDLGLNDGRKDRLQNPDRAELEFCEIAGLVDRSTQELRGAWLTLEDGFEYEGQRYRSLTVIAERITGAHWSGPRFFGMSKRARAV